MVDLQRGRLSSLNFSDRLPSAQAREPGHGNGRDAELQGRGSPDGAEVPGGASGAPQGHVAGV